MVKKIQRAKKAGKSDQIESNHSLGNELSMKLPS